MVESEIEGVEIAPPAHGQVGRRPIGDQGHALLGGPAVRAQGRVEAGQVVAALAAADDGEPFRYDHEIADAVLGQLETRAGSRTRQHELDAGQGGYSSLDVGNGNAALDVNGGKRAERAVMNDVGIGD